MESFMMLMISASCLCCGLSGSTNTSLSKQDLQIEIGGAVYSPIEDLDEKSAIVAEGRTKLLDESDLQALISDLRRLAKFMRIAYNGAGAAGPKYVELKIEIRGIGNNITDLCDETDRTLKKFKTTSKNIVIERQAAYQFVADGFEEMGVEILTALADDADDMENAALQLHDEFRWMAQDVDRTLKHAMRTQAKQDIEFKELRSNRIKWEETRSEQQKKAEEAKKRKLRARREALKYEMLEDESIRQMYASSKYMKSFVNFGAKFASRVLSKFAGTDPIDDNIMGDDAERTAEMFHKWRLEQLQFEEKERELQYQALNALKNAALKIADIDSVFESEESIAGAVVEALHQSVGALMNLSDVMRATANIWRELEDQFNMLADQQFPKGSDDTRLALWSSSGIKKGYIMESAQWFAMHILCREIGGEIKKTKRQLHDFMRENPTTEQSRRIIREMANEFIDDVEQEQDNIKTALKNARDEMNTLQQMHPRHDEI